MAGPINEKEEFEFALAWEHSKQNSQPPPQTDPNSRGKDIAGDVVKAGIKGLGTAGEFIGDVADYALVHPASRILGFDPEIAQKGRDSIKESLSPTLERTTKKGENPLLDAGLTGAEFGASSLVPGGGLSKTKAAIEAGIFGGGAGVGSLLSGDNEMGSLLGGVVASTRGGFVPQLLGGSYDMLKRAGSETARLSEAQKILTEYAKNNPAALAKAREAIDAGETGTIGQLSGDKGWLALENRLAGDAKFDEGLKDINRELSSNALSSLRAPVPKGVDTALPLATAKNSVEEQVRVAGSKLDSELAASESAARGQIEGIETAAKITGDEQAAGLQKTIGQLEQQASDKVAAGESLLQKTIAQMDEQGAKNLEEFNLRAGQEAAMPGAVITATGPEGAIQARKGVNKAYRDAWSEVSEVPASVATNVKAAVTEAQKGLTLKDAGELNSVLKEVDSVMANPTVAKLESFDNLLRQKTNSAAGGEINYALMDSFKKIRESVTSSLPTEAQKAFKAANAQYPSYLARRRASGSPGAQKRGGLFTEEELKTASNQIGGEVARVEGRAPLQATSEAGLGRTANESTARAEALRRSDEANALVTGESKASVNAAKTASKEAVNTSKSATKEAVSNVNSEAKAQAKALRELELAEVTKAKTSAPAIYSKVEDPVRAVGKILDGDTPTEGMKQLVSIMKKPAEREGLRGGVIESLVSRVSKEGDITSGGVAKFDKIAKSLDGLFTPAELKDMRKGLMSADKIFSGKGVKMADLPQAGEGLGFYMLTMAGLNLGAKFGPNPLMGATVGKTIARKLGSGTPHKKTLGKLEDIMLNPKNYIDELENLANNPKSKEASERLIDKALQRSVGPIGQTQNIKDQKD